MIERDQLWIETARKLEEVSAKISFLEGEKSKISKSLVELSQEVDSCGAGYEYKMFERIGSVNYKSIPELAEIDLSPYRASNVKYWKLSFKKKFEEIL